MNVTTNNCLEHIVKFKVQSTIQSTIETFTQRKKLLEYCIVKAFWYYFHS